MKFQQIKYTLITILSLIVFMNSGFAQIFPRGSRQDKEKQMFGPSLFLYSTATFKSEKDVDKIRLDVFIAFANDILQFVKERQGNFSAEYELLVSVFDRKGNLVVEKSNSQKIKVNNFEKTNNRRLTNRYKFSFHLIPGEYRLVIHLTDMDIQKTLRREAKIKLKGFNLANDFISDVLFCNSLNITEAGDIETIHINIPRRFFNPDSSFWAYFEIYPRSFTDSLKLRYSILNSHNKLVGQKNMTLVPQKSILPYLIDLSKYIKVSGHYNLILNISQKKVSKTKREKFSVIWRNSSMAKMDIDLMIKTMKEYIPAKDYKRLLTASDSAKQAYFKEYWKERDPTPNTSENELLEEFSRRVEFANNYFSVHALRLEGWQTDRGKIYIKYGPPTDVERHLEEINLPPFEIWYYQHLQRRFIFEDKSGMGDFKLVRIE